MYDKDGTCPLSERKTIFEYYTEPFYLRWLKHIPFIRTWIDRYFHDWVITGYDLARGLIITQKNSIKLVEEFQSSDTLTEKEKTNLQILNKEIQKNISDAEHCIAGLSVDYPISYKCAITRKAIRMLLSNERRSIEQCVEQGLLTEENAQQMIDELSERYKNLTTIKMNQLLVKHNLCL